MAFKYFPRGVSYVGRRLLFALFSLRSSLPAWLSEPHCTQEVLVPCLCLTGSMTLTWSLPHSGPQFRLETSGSKAPLRSGYLQVSGLANSSLSSSHGSEESLGFDRG